MNELLRKLKLLRNEDIIWLIYYFIVTFALISNRLEKNYLLNNENVQSRNTSRKINTTLLIIAFFIYLYFTVVAFQDIELLKQNSTKKEVRISYERLITNLIFLAGGIMAIIADFDDNTNDVVLDIL